MKFIKPNLAFLVLFAALALPITAYLTYSTLWQSKEYKEVSIAPNSSVKSIARKLEAEGVIFSKIAFRVFFHLYKMRAKYSTLKAGYYSFPLASKQSKVLEALFGGKVKKYSMTIIEGKTAGEIYTEASSNENLEIDINSIQEGSLLPDTYIYARYDQLSSLIKKAAKEQEIFLDEAWENRDTKIDNVIKNKKEVIILASILEKESSDPTEKRQIASVFISRLKKKMPLQSCATVIYGIKRDKSFERKLFHKDLKTKSEYNTYIKPGLPPGPICMPSKDSIWAALHPEWSDKMFFRVGDQGKHLFSITFQEHVKAKIN